jgi:nifR3 family TIM-barrel protein
MWRVLQKPFFVLAPMADVTDVPFRTIVAQCSKPDVFYAEFVSAHGLASAGRERLMLDLAIGEYDHPIVAQFFGTNPEHLYSAGKLANELGFDGVDINMGCPDRAIVKQGAGSALIKQPELAQELISALREGATSANQRIPVAVKTRLGIYKTEEMDAWIPKLLEAKPDVLIVHGRTVKEMSKVPAHWDLIGRATEMAHDVGVLCVGNGDVISRAQGNALAQQYNVDGIMVGRGIFQNPWLFENVEREHTPQKRLELLIKHVDLWEKQWGGVKSFDLMKKFFKMYVSGWDGAAYLRAQLMETKSADEVRTLISQSID